MGIFKTDANSDLYGDVNCNDCDMGSNHQQQMCHSSELESSHNVNSATAEVRDRHVRAAEDPNLADSTGVDQRPCDSSHATSDQERAHPGTPESGRDPAQTVGHDRIGEPHSRAARGKGHGPEQGQGAHPTASWHGGTQQAQQEEGRSPDVPGAIAAHSHLSQRDHCGAAAHGHQEDLPDHRSDGRRPCWVWSPCQPIVPRAEGQPRVLRQVGDEDSSRGVSGLPTHPPGQLVGTGAGQSHVTGSSANHDSISEDHQEQDPEFSRIQRRIQLGLAAGYSAADGPNDEQSEGRCGQSQGVTSSQEEERCNHSRGEPVHGILQRSLRGLDADDDEELRPIVSDPTVKYEGIGMSHTCVKDQWEPLPEPKARHLSQCAEQLLLEAFEALLRHQRIELLEVACSPDSILTSTMQKLTKSELAARRYSLFNQYDLGTNSGVHGVINEITTLKPKHVWLSPLCGPYSVMQNINQRTPQQCEELAQKRREALKQYIGCSFIYTFCVQNGIHVTWEWSQSCQGWRLPLI